MTLGTELNLSVVLFRQGNNREAEEVLVDLLEAQKKVSGLRYHETTVTAINLALAKRRQGKHREAEQILRDVLEDNLEALAEIECEVWEPMHTRNLQMLEYATSLRAGWVMDDYIAFAYRKLIETRLRVFGETNVEQIVLMHRLYCALRRLEQDQEAKRVSEQALHLLENVDWEEELAYSRFLHIAIELFKQKEYSEAEPYARKSLELQMRFSSYSARPMRDTASYYAEILSARQKHEAAVKVCREMVDHTREHMGPNDKQTFHAEHALAKALNSQGSYIEAEELCRLTLSKRQQSLNNIHPHTQKSRRLLVEILRSLERTEEADEMELEIQCLEAERKVQ